MEQVTVGRIVHYVMPEGYCRPAVVVRARKAGANLQVFLGPNDLAGSLASEGGAIHHERAYGSMWRSEVKYAKAEKSAAGTWHWPEGSKSEKDAKEE